MEIEPRSLIGVMYFVGTVMNVLAVFVLDGYDDHVGGPIGGAGCALVLLALAAAFVKSRRSPSA